MALNLVSFPNPFDTANPIAPAYAWLAGVYLDISLNQGRAVFNVHPNEAAWQSNPLGQVAISLGQELVKADPQANPPVESVKFPTLEELMSDPEFAAAYAVIGTKLYAAAANAPQFVGATQV